MSAGFGFDVTMSFRCAGCRRDVGQPPAKSDVVRVLDVETCGPDSGSIVRHYQLRTKCPQCGGRRIRLEAGFKAGTGAAPACK